MPQPTRIEYENAFYHVMNRGRSRNNIFFKDLHYQTFLKILEESCSRFEAVIHCCRLKDIANIFNLKDSKSSGFSLARIRREIKSGLHKDELDKIKAELGVINT